MQPWHPKISATFTMSFPAQRGVKENLQRPNEKMHDHQAISSINHHFPKRNYGSNLHFLCIVDIFVPESTANYSYNGTMTQWTFLLRLILILVVQYNMNKSPTKFLAQSKEKDWIAIVTRSDQIFPSESTFGQSEIMFLFSRQLVIPIPQHSTIRISKV